MKVVSLFSGCGGLDLGLEQVSTMPMSWGDDPSGAVRSGAVLRAQIAQWRAPPLSPEEPPKASNSLTM